MFATNLSLFVYFVVCFQNLDWIMWSLLCWFIQFCIWLLFSSLQYNFSVFKILSPLFWVCFFRFGFLIFSCTPLQLCEERFFLGICPVMCLISVWRVCVHIIFALLLIFLKCAAVLSLKLKYVYGPRYYGSKCKTHGKTPLWL